MQVCRETAQSLHVQEEHSYTAATTADAVAMSEQSSFLWVEFSAVLALLARPGTATP